MKPQIVSIAVIGKQNNPLYLKVFSEKKTELIYHFMIHSTCDELEGKLHNLLLSEFEEDGKKLQQISSESSSNAKLNERSQTSVNVKTECSDTYLGLLHMHETSAVYGSVTNTKIKFIVVLDMSEMIITDADMKSLFKEIHSAYIVQVCNPFYSLDDKTPIQSRRFDKMIQQIVESWTSGA
ncbi:hypothetical protein T552_02731 [Pneumocystis carinii B80]|uniref:Trafficking protein particle complex subunit 2-like protein n=1 Tax=Pneumocystis carinii (strain B80) TaxID=1408658 RepID=A0A0W4ZEB9_PNEC8|nr:hypothetical protein T552_02731 [Pneumocystis carinii B80]KTW26726.1 hypothetical protein T552_02731 [Pneumocystis carinii B80]